ncbi:MAG TPA: hypothetical protein VGN61_09880 [Verrucomicrobiae bacterium]|jgi:hypothetical protein
MNAELLNIFLSENGAAHARRNLLDATLKQRAADDPALGPNGEHKLSLDESEKAFQEDK